MSRAYILRAIRSVESGELARAEVDFSKVPQPKHKRSLGQLASSEHCAVGRPHFNTAARAYMS